MYTVMVSEVLEEITGNLFLVTRPMGIQVRDRIVEIIQEVENDLIVLDFKNVKIIDYSGADEVVVRLVSRLVNKELGEKYIILRNLEQIHRDNLQAAFQIHKKHSLLEIHEEDLTLIGNIKPMLIDVLQKVYNEDVRTARHLADITNSSINLASTKLLQLYQERLIMRKEETLFEGGRQYLYFPIINKFLRET